jgi:hypothetical protein
VSEKKNLLEIDGFVDLVKILDEELLSENPDVNVKKHSLQEQFIEVIRDANAFEERKALLDQRKIEIQESFSEFGKKTRGRRRRVFAPVIKSVTPPHIVQSSAQQITFSGENFGNEQIDVFYSFGGSSATSTAIPENQGTSASTFVPADVSNNVLGTAITMSIVANGFTSNSVQSSVVNVVKMQPSLTSITGDIQNGVATTLTIVGSNFGSGAPGHPAIVQFNIGGSITNQNAATTNNFEVTVVVPAAVYSQSAGTVVNIKVFENDTSTPFESSNSINKTIIS